MQTANYLDQARSFLSQNAQRLALRVVPMALVAVAASHAATTFNAPNNSFASNNCSGGSVSSSLTGSVTGGGSGVILSGNASTGLISSCTLTMAWQGTGSGTFVGSTATLGSNIPPSFTITPTTAIVTGYTLTVKINGQVQNTTTCVVPLGQSLIAANRPAPRIVTSSTCSGPITISPQPLTSPSTVTLSTWEVDLAVGAAPTDVIGSLTISVSSAGSIDLTTPAAVVTVPVLSSAALGLTALMLLGLAAFKLVGWKPSGGGSSRPF